MHWEVNTFEAQFPSLHVSALTGCLRQGVFILAPSSAVPRQSTYFTLPQKSVMYHSSVTWPVKNVKVLICVFSPIILPLYTEFGSICTLQSFLTSSCSEFLSFLWIISLFYIRPDLYDQGYWNVQQPFCISQTFTNHAHFGVKLCAETSMTVIPIKLF